MHFLFDENVPHRFVEGLKHIEFSNRKSCIQAEVSHPKLLDKAGISDAEIIALAGQLKAIIITFDGDFKSIKSYYQLYKQFKVGVVFFKLSKKDSNYWGIVKLLINKWEDIKLTLKEKVPPYAFEVSSQGIKEYAF